MVSPAVKVQTWVDNLRLPIFQTVGELTALLSAVEPYRAKPAIPFQSKHLPALKRNVWYVLRRPVDRSRTGHVVIWPAARCCVFVSGDPLTPKRPHPRVALLRLRIDPQFIAPGTGPTIFAATLSGVARRLWIEDVVLWKGRPVEEPFSQRVRRAAQWLEHYCILDSRLLDGVEVELAPWAPLAALEPDGVWELQSDEEGARRLLWIANHTDPILDVSPSLRPMTGSAIPAIPTLEEGPLVAVATRESGPDQWALASADGVLLGRALIRRLEVSAALREVRVGTQRVEVRWVGAFGKWEVVGLSTQPTSHSGVLEAAKNSAA